MNVVSLCLSIIAVCVSILTLLFSVLREYREVLTLYFFADSDIVYIPIICDETQEPVNFCKKYWDEFHKSIIVCQFKHSWMGNVHNVYYGQTFNDRFGNIEGIVGRKLFDSDFEVEYFHRCILTRKGKQHVKHLMKSIKSELHNW